MKQENKTEFECSGGAQCPFWKHEFKMATYCEGAKILHPNKAEKMSFKQTYCCNTDGGYKECTVYKIMTEYYEKLYESGEVSSYKDNN